MCSIRKLITRFLDVSASFNGLTTKGEAEIWVNGSDQYNKYRTYAGSSVTFDGGDSTLAAKLALDPHAEDVWDTFQQWKEGSDKRVDAVGFVTQELWRVLAYSTDPTIIQLGENSQKVWPSRLLFKLAKFTQAFDYLVKNPKVHYTECSLFITSDWGHFTIESPEAYVEAHPPGTEVPNGVTWGLTEINWRRSQYDYPVPDVEIP